jgi:hypothetical protein
MGLLLSFVGRWEIDGLYVSWLAMTMLAKTMRAGQSPDFNGELIKGGVGNLGYYQGMPLLLEHLTSLRQEITDLRNMNARSGNRSADSQIDQSAVEMRANRLLEIKKELSQMLNRPEDPRVWWEKGGRRNRVA